MEAYVAKRIVYSREALKALGRIDRRTAARIVLKIEQLAEDAPSLAGNIIALKGGGEQRRLRVGDWRVIYRDHAVIDILKIAPRGSAYE